MNGATLREKIRTKDGKITKAKAQMRKSASALSPEALYFFRDEMEKEAIITPASAIKAMTYAKPGMFGNMVRGAGKLSLKGHLAAMRHAPAISQAALTNGNVLPAMAGIAAGGATKMLASKIPALAPKAPMLSSYANALTENALNFV